jgi:hypothetical protein
MVPAGSDYMFSARARRRKRKIVRACGYDGLPCEFCPHGCEYLKRLKTAMHEAKRPLHLSERESLFERLRGLWLGMRAES